MSYDPLFDCDSDDLWHVLGRVPGVRNPRTPTVLRGYHRDDDSPRIAEAPLDIWGQPRQARPTKGNAMSVDNAKLELWVDALRDVLANGVKPRFPAEPPIGSVLRFNRTYDRKTSGPKSYDYVALRSENGWHVTGRENAVLPWEVLLERIGDNDCALVAEYVDIPHREANPLDAIEDPRDWVRAVFTDPAALKAAGKKSKAVDAEK
jgi:hypothetical protein